ncbi:hypothetical protein EV363DRAFT_1162211 [Boletus edulis]|nr:hypothetical protein EV363DRAFT_1162211 [Boletus edulis]
MAPSERSISSGSSNASPPQNLVALPSMTHSLAALPTMSSLPHDMMHYNAAAHSRARMEHALQKQRQQGPAHAALSVSLTFVLVAHPLIIVKRHMTCDARPVQHWPRTPRSLFEDSKTQNKAMYVMNRFCVPLRARSDDDPHRRRFSHATADDRTLVTTFCAERNSSVVDDVCIHIVPTLSRQG